MADSNVSVSDIAADTAADSSADIRNAVVCSKVHKKFGDVTALNGVDLQIPEGSLFGFLGPNGAGKTTLIKILTGLITQNSGSCRVSGVDGRDAAADHRFEIGYLSQDPSYYPWMTGEELLDFVGSVFGFSRIDRRQRTEELLEMTGLADAARRKIGGYSGGMVQRLGIAQAIYHRPKVVFLDEPVSALDPIGRKEVLDFIRLLKEQSTVCMSTHILDDVERVCTDVAIIRNGEILLTADTEELLTTYSPEFYILTFETAGDTEAAEKICRSIGAECISKLDLSMTEKSSTAYSGNTIRLSLEGYREHRSRLLAEIASRNLRLNDISRESARLEDIFIEIIQKEEQK